MGKIYEWKEIFEGIENEDFFFAGLIYPEEILKNGFTNNEEAFLYEEVENKRKETEEYEKEVQRIKEEISFFKSLMFREDDEKTFFDYYGIGLVEKDEIFSDLTEFYKENNVETIKKESFFLKDNWQRVDESFEFYPEDGAEIERYDMVKKILEDKNTFVKDTGDNVKIEVKNTNNISSEFDIDNVSELLSQKLCEIMSVCADGIY